ncbi:MAG: hypothetical protein A3D65_04225 [Candidatus Lloydbacteria bacterium RIFCSPHIGHO2_02_FULL_50_13]|uniref:Pesticidal crystal protein Cry22Aa Ig-like domain-containing protein n=1 Tax=Candidatus Lloydbacteria bacterium RIFCSPHIGHO2_02_FULL_50_13 TaxID=1798661 RepID=A0A1G2DA64_9BACT|nr:MAG: hypothetical protein A3D65_04225 [Candidatus Lloydbacteria bacterium RIFCSPHIGHO2_02_FULL_50_13]
MQKFLARIFILTLFLQASVIPPLVYTQANATVVFLGDGDDDDEDEGGGGDDGGDEDGDDGGGSGDGESTPPQCADGSDNDADGKADFPDDPGCANFQDTDEHDAAPTLTLLGDASINVVLGDSFADPGATASDPEDGDLTEHIIRSGAVETQIVGTYTLTYTVSDTDGRTATPVTRTVTVVSGEGGGATVPPANGGTGQGGGGSVPPQCADGSDNDADGKADFPNDGGCENSADNDEGGPVQPETPGGGDGATIPPGGGGTGQGGGVVQGAATTSAAVPGEVLGESECFYLRDYLRLSRENDPAEVMKLQTFLRDFEGFTDLPVTGFFGTETDKAVREFQDRYADDVLLPWNLPSNTGYVYYTTRKKVNEIYCQSVFPLDQNQINEISAFRELISGLNTAKPKPETLPTVGVDTTTEKTEGLTTIKDTSVRAETSREEAVPISAKERQGSLKDILQATVIVGEPTEDVSLGENAVARANDEREETPKQKSGAFKAMISAAVFIALAVLIAS